MVITYYGKAYFKLTLGDLTIALNPPAKNSKAFGGKAPRFGADISLACVRTPDYGDAETVTLGDKEPFAIDGPGSYEVHDIFIAGGVSTVTLDGVSRINTVYGFELDNIKVAVLGLVDDEKALSSEAKEIAGNADMIFVAVGADPAKSYKLAVSFGPNVIVPCEYDAKSLAQFLKEGGQDKVAALDKLTLKRRDLDGKEGVIMTLDPQA